VDYERALVKVEAYGAQCEGAIAIQRTSHSAYSSRPEWQDRRRQIIEGLPLMEQVTEAIDPRLAERLRTGDSAIQFKNKLEVCHEMRGTILSRQEVAEILGP